MKKKTARFRTIGVIMGGDSNERAVSLMSGKNVLEALIRLGYDAVGIDARSDLAEKLRDHGVDAVFIAMHGLGGEDGTIQGFLEYLNIPYTGSGVIPSAIAMDKMATKRIMQSAGLPTPDFLPIRPEEDLAAVCERILERFGMPVVIKPNCEGSSIGVKIVNDKGLLFRAVQEVRNQYDSLFAEQFIGGKELTVGVLGTGPHARALPVLELEPKQLFYDYEAKYTEGMTDFIVPATVAADLQLELQRMSVELHNLLGCRDMSRVDFMLDQDLRPYILEINTIPGFTSLSDLPAEARADGMTFDELVEVILESAFSRSVER